MKKLIITILSIVVLANSSFASSKGKDFFFVNLKGTLSNKMIVNSSFGNPMFQSSNTIFGEVGIGYKHLWNNGIGIKTSLDVGALPASFEYNLSNRQDNFIVNNWYLGINAMFVKQFNINERHAIGVNLGLKEYFFGPARLYTVSASNADTGKQLIANIDFYEASFITSIVFAPEYIYTFDNGNYMSFGIDVNYSPFKLYTDSNSEYTFSSAADYNHIDQGTFEFGANYIGLSFEFGFN